MIGDALLLNKAVGSNMDCDDNTGMCVPYRIRLTPDKGRGVFADSIIPKGSIIWRHVPGQYAVYNEQSLKELLADSSHSEAVYDLTHNFFVAEFPGYMVKVFDAGALINHSDQPTMMMNAGSRNYEAPSVTSEQDVSDALMDTHFALIAAQNVDVGDELTLDYNVDAEEPLYYEILCKQYGVSWDWL